MHLELADTSAQAREKPRMSARVVPRTPMERDLHRSLHGAIRRGLEIRPKETLQ